MKDRNKRSSRHQCAQPREEDANSLWRSNRAERNPRKWRENAPPAPKDQREGGSERKTLQLCKQVCREANSVLAQSHWAIETGTSVASAHPAPDASTLRLVLLTQGDPQRVHMHAAMAIPAMRGAIARASSRKRTPQLLLLVLQDLHAIEDPAPQDPAPQDPATPKRDTEHHHDAP